MNYCISVYLYVIYVFVYCYSFHRFRIKTDAVLTDKIKVSGNGVLKFYVHLSADILNNLVG